MGRIYKQDSKSDVWYADYIDQNGNRKRRSTGCKDKANAAKLLAKWETEARMIGEGLLADPVSLQRETIESQLQKLQSHMAAKGDSAEHITRTIKLIRDVVAFNNWIRMRDVSRDGIADYAAYLKSNGLAARTRGAMITAMRTLCRYCVERGVLRSDPTVGIKKPSVQEDRRIERRMLSFEEWRWLSKALEAGPDRNGMAGHQRRLMYRTAIETGLRSGELRALKVANLQLDVDQPHIIAKAKITKNSKTVRQFISDKLAADLADFVHRKSPGVTVFAVADRTQMAGTLRKDVEDARQLWIETAKPKKHEIESDFLKSPNAEGEIIDFHALRHTAGAWRVINGMTLPECQQLMRHSTIVLTIDCYGHLAKDAMSNNRNLLEKLIG
ncbi:MAG: site-specific integrase [bacterium]|nr:site-specific integrase [bacterium]